MTYWCYVYPNVLISLVKTIGKEMPILLGAKQCVENVRKKFHTNKSQKIITKHIISFQLAVQDR